MTREQAQDSLRLINDNISLIKSSYRFGYIKLPNGVRAEYHKTLAEQLQRYQALARIYNDVLNENENKNR